MMFKLIGGGAMIAKAGGETNVRGMFDRRDFIKMTGYASGAAVFGSLWTAVDACFGLESFPAKKITWIVPTTAGGGKDIRVRGIAPYLQKYIKAVAHRPNNVGVVVKNMPGAANMKAYNFTHNSKPDGYTLCEGSESLHVNAVLGTLAFNVFDLTYIARLAEVNKVLVTSSKSNLHSWEDIVKASKKGTFRFGVSGFAGANHVATVIFIDTTRLTCKTVLFDGASGVTGALIRGDVHVGMYSEDSVGHLVDAQEMRPLISFSDTTRYQKAQKIKEIGFPELNNVFGSQEYLIAAPGTSQSTKNILVGALKKALADRDFLAWNKKMGMDVDPVFGADLDNWVKKMQTFYMSKEKLFKEYLSDKA